MFLKCCKSGEGSFLPSTTAWYYLGLSCLRLGELTHAEDAISQANILDHLNPRPWGLMAVLCLQNGHLSRKNQADLCFKEALRMGLKEVDLLEEIGDLYAREDVTVMSAIESYRELVAQNPEYGEGWQKLGDTLCRIQLGRANEAINAYKQAIQLVEGEGNR